MSDAVDARNAEVEQAAAKSAQVRLEFLRTELAFVFTLARLADTEVKIGDLEGAESCIAQAEKGYSTLRRFLSDPKHASHITDEEHMEFTTGMERVRSTLDDLKRAKR